LLVSLLKHML